MALPSNATGANDSKASAMSNAPRPRADGVPFAAFMRSAPLGS